jgi:glycerol-1-phosphate dehydrogenase [NAD(P)+]
MDINNLLSGVDCSCGKKHSCDIKYVYIEKNAILRLKDICAPFNKILLVADQNTFGVAGDKTVEVLGDKLFDKVVFSGEKILIPNEESIEKVENSLCDADLIVGIGSGVIQDLCKYVSFDKKVPYLIVATAPSMDGYASVGAALILEEMKVTLNARVPYAILAEDDVICTAPVEMLQSGYGDIVGKYSCLNDWKLAHLLRNEYFCDFVYNFVMSTVKNTEATAKAVLAREPAAIRNLMEGLVSVGIMMSYVGNSRPASGSEHHLSHFFEITGLLNHTPYYLHGIDVLYSAAVTAQLRQKLRTLKCPLVAKLPSEATRQNEIKRIYTTAADGIISLQNKVGFYDDLNVQAFDERWEEICCVLSEAPSYETMLTYLKAIGLDIHEFNAFYGSNTIQNAILYAKDLKDRYTVLWLCYALGIDKFDA